MKYPICTRLALLLITLLPLIPTTASVKEEELYVTLTAEKPLLPICIGDIESEESSDKNYCKKNYYTSLLSILTFDFNANGMTAVIEGEKRRAALKEQPKFDIAPHLEPLAKAHISYLLTTQCKNDHLNVKLYDIQSEIAHSVEGVRLSGDLNQDRRVLHKLSDTLFEMLFKTPGIATSKILCTVKSGTNELTTAEVFEADYDGGNSRKLTNLGTLVACPQWIPQPSRGANSSFTPTSFIFIGYTGGQPKLYMSCGTKTPKKILTMRGNQMTPAISSDGAWVAFASDILGTSDLFLVPFNKDVGAMGKPRHLFHAKGAACASPTFSPDGKKIAFAANIDGTPRIYILDTPEIGTPLAAIKPRLLSKKSREATAPAWSPDGTKIAFTGRVGGGPRQIWLYDFETASETQLTKGAENKENPSWAPNSLHLLFNSYGKKSELYLMNIRHVHPVKISDPKISNENVQVQFAVFAPKSVQE